mgnify:CR=1 FL=1
MKKAYIRTFGCQMNVYDTGKMLALLKNDGYEETQEMDDADLVIVNTCSIREKPELKVHSFLGEARKIKRNRPDKDMTIAISGCVAQQEGKNLLNRYPDVNLVFGPDAVPNISTLLSATQNQKQVLDTTFLDEADYVFASDIDPNATQRVGAFVTIQKGCDNKCTFCIVPTTRGKEVSRPSEQIVAEVQALVEQGIKEITLLGQNVNSYGRDLMIDNKRKPYFTELLYKIHEIDGIQRIRFTSPHPKDFKIETLKAVAELPKVANQIHIPLQSGSNKILSAMHRGYNQKRFLEKIDLIKSLIPNVSISSDIIVGFPGENHEDFNQTMEVVNYSEFDLIYMFKFSPRPGTVASDYVDQFVAKENIDDRFMRLKVRQTEISEKRYKRFENTKQLLLVEKISKKDNNILTGRIEGGHIVHLESSSDNIGKLLNVKIYDSTPFFLKATL